ncbi:rac GTPase-activating protein 1-like [Ptychodera flava]|uniref:rac GTPase-activating protein 1-like n=1 Tax=Ptychodera flava TaxID=63121 RepID=UPI00396A75F2
MTSRYGSLVTAFDDIVRCTSIPTQGCESEFLQFVKHQEECRKRWLEAELEAGQLKEKLAKLQAERDTYDVTLKHIRYQLDVEMKKRQKSELGRDALDRQLALVRELLNDGNRISMLNEEERQSLAFLSATNLQAVTPNKRLSTVDESGDLLSASDVSYDHTEEDLDDVSYLRDGKQWHRTASSTTTTTTTTKPKKRPSAPPLEPDVQEQPKKVRKSVTTTDADQSIVTTTTVNVPSSGPITATTHVEAIRSPPNRLPSTNSVDSDDYNMRGTPSTPVNRGRRMHTFCSKTVIKPESCNPCQKRIGFGKLALKCKDCRSVCHPDCRDLVPLPCVPTTTTPGTGAGKKGQPTSLEYFTPNSSPMVPALIINTFCPLQIHCCTEIERRGFMEQGIYRVPGSERQVKELKEKLLKGKGNPNLHQVNDIHVVCGALKDFFRGLNEPLVTYRLHSHFVRAAEMYDETDSHTAIYQAVSELPQCNRDTLAYMILHLQRVSEAPTCKMPLSNLAKVFGPTLVGHNNPEPSPIEMLEDTKKQAKVMHKLFAMPEDFWNAFVYVDIENEVIYNRNAISSNTPEAKPTPSSMLGPLTTPGKKASKSSSSSSMGSVGKKSLFSRTPMTPRAESTKSHKKSSRPRHFFSSPKLV